MSIHALLEISTVVSELVLDREPLDFLSASLATSMLCKTAYSLMVCCNKSDSCFVQRPLMKWSPFSVPSGGWCWCGGEREVVILVEKREGGNNISWNVATTRVATTGTEDHSHVWPKVVFCFLAGGSCVLDGLVRFFFFCFDMFCQGDSNIKFRVTFAPLFT